MASEDSDHVIARDLAIHRLCNLKDAREAFSCEVFASLNDLETLHEFLEIELLRCPERVAPEKRND